MWERFLRREPSRPDTLKETPGYNEFIAALRENASDVKEFPAGSNRMTVLFQPYPEVEAKEGEGRSERVDVRVSCRQGQEDRIYFAKEDGPLGLWFGWKDMEGNWRSSDRLYNSPYNGLMPFSQWDETKKNWTPKE